MNYREPKEIFLRSRDRFFLVPTPGAPGQWMLCHPAVMVACPVCESAAGMPCRAENTGHITITARQAREMLRVLESGETSRKTELREVLQARRLYRTTLHEQREVRWRGTDLCRPSRRPDAFVENEVERMGRVLDRIEARLRDGS